MEPVFVLFSSTVMKNSSNETKEIVGIARDITDIKETEKKYKTLFEEVKDAKREITELAERVRKAVEGDSR